MIHCATCQQIWACHSWSAAWLSIGRDRTCHYHLFYLEEFKSNLFFENYENQKMNPGDSMLAERMLFLGVFFYCHLICMYIGHNS